MNKVYFGDGEVNLPSVLLDAKKFVAGDVEVYLQEKISLKARVAKGVVINQVSGIDRFVAVRSWLSKKKRVGFAACGVGNSWNEMVINATKNAVQAATLLGSEFPFFPAKLIPLAESELDNERNRMLNELFQDEQAIKDLTSTKALELYSIAKDEGKVLQAECFLQIIRFWIVNSCGVLVKDWRSEVILLCQVLREPARTGVAMIRGTIGNPPNPLSVVKKAAKRCCLVNNLDSLPTGMVTVLLQPQAVAKLIVMIGRALSGELIQTNMSMFSNKISKKVASSAFSLYDSPDSLLPDSGKYDMEGVPMSILSLIKDGVLLNTLDNLATSDVRNPNMQYRGGRAHRIFPWSIPSPQATVLKVVAPSVKLDDFKTQLIILNFGGLRTINVGGGIFHVTAQVILPEQIADFNNGLNYNVGTVFVTLNIPDILKNVCGSWGDSQVVSEKRVVVTPALVLENINITK
ncbi:hypothetical protein BBF96_10270 [Anoxybacter fermentans]|uniref:Metalloprotease TldD/E C-terminal domain-containing protein n=1 Tax=Anoxybacter fermentans TaxID=1323375 RepID=A0A3Q9HQV5_9FIRM|nr:metallopeptidase TldD-related protein [Anoxybacter fermentans]AZR73735.1 hypothetical protein BBF96_10270 [Anoxybacter fermentans]